MQANYVIVKQVENDNKKTYSIFERQTEQVVKTFSTYEDARKSVKKFNTTGFCGWTPSFILLDPLKKSK